MIKKLCILLVVVFVLDSKATIHQINISIATCTPTFTISPTTINAICGDTIEWVSSGCPISVVTGIIPNCASTLLFTTPANTFTTTVSCAGIYNYKCFTYANATFILIDTIAVNVTCTAAGISRVPFGSISNLNTQISIYPNPTKDVLNVELGMLNGNTTLSIMDVLGNTIYHSIFTTQHHTINLSSFPDGVYYLSLKTTDGITTKKVILQH